MSRTPPTVQRLIGILPADTSVREYHEHAEKKYATLQMLCATTAAADYLVTRNPRDFDSDSIAVVTPAELLVTLRS